MPDLFLSLRDDLKKARRGLSERADGDLSGEGEEGLRVGDVITCFRGILATPSIHDALLNFYYNGNATTTRSPF